LAGSYASPMPRSWQVSMVLLIAACLASIVIALVKLF
jgi:hypothetical protein